MGGANDGVQLGQSAPAGESMFVTAGGTMAALIQRHDWSASLGPIEQWPASLRTIVRIMVTSRYAMWMGWGKDLTFFCNDAYTPTLGVKHPWALGQPASKVWEEIWPDIGPRAETVIRTGHATWDEGLLLFLERSGYPEETYHTFSYSPLPDDSGAVGGMLCVVTEETDRIIGERRLSTLRELAAELAGVRTEADMWQAIERGLATNRRDLPMAAVYMFDPDSGAAILTCCADASMAAAIPQRLHVDGTPLPSWPIGRILDGEARVLVSDLAHLPPLPQGGWDKPPRQAVLVPIQQQGLAQPIGVLVAALNPYRPFSDAYADFLDLVAAQIASGLASARAYEAERQRAEALAEIDRAKTAFFSNVSHEFRTPLTLMLGPLEEELALRDGEPAARVAMAYRNGLRLLRLVNMLLDFSRIEAGRLRASFRPNELARFTTGLVSNFRSACEKAGLALVVRCDPLPEPVYVDADMWERIVLNLVSNAFKYTLEGGITVTLAASSDGAAAELTVRDTGVGIPAEELPRIFERFHRIEGQRGRTNEGSGIGLALLHELVRLHAGDIVVESVVDVGTTVSVRLPFGKAHLPADRISETPGRDEPEEAASAAFVEEALRWLPAHGGEAEADLALPPVAGADMPRRASILLADDNADMRDYVSRLLGPHYDVVAVPDGEAALTAARARRPDLIVSDIMMPRLDGFGLLAAVRSEPALRDTPFILLSARAGEEARVEGVEAGADDYLVKPFAARELLARVRSNLELARLRREAEAALRLMNDTLQQRVDEAITQRMAVEEALRQAQKMEAVGHLTGGVAHDFNNLLTVINGGVEILERLFQAGNLASEEPRARRALAMIAQGSQRAATLTHRLLAFARRQTLDPQPTDINRLVATMSELLRRTLGERIDVETVLAGGLWQTMIDANQLENAMLNLAVNARDAMPDGGRLTIETANTYLDEAYVETFPDVEPGQYVMVAISDTGTGMTPETQERVFEPFFTTKDIGHGTGLGLSQVYGFIKQSRGHVKIYSEVGQGTAVKLYLPRLHSMASAQTTPAGRLAAPAGSGETILVVEDDPDVRAHSVETLRDLGYRVVPAADGVAALAVLDRDPQIAMLFTDVGLPGGMTGRQLADEVRRRRPGIKVLYTTGYARNAIVHGGVLDPGTKLLPKPFTYLDLAARVRSVLDEA